MLSKSFSAFVTSAIQFTVNSLNFLIYFSSVLKERFKEAEETYQAGIKNCPDSSDLHNNYGVFLVDSGK